MDMSNLAVVAFILTGFIAFVVTLMAASIYVALGEGRPAEPDRRTLAAKRLEVARVSPPSHG
jgi:hypothetical protein